MKHGASIASLYQWSKESAARLEASELASLQRQDGGHTALVVAGNWAAIATAIAAALLWPGLPTAAAAVVFVGGRQLALWVLAHDGVHGLLARHRATNDRIARWLLAAPIALDFDEFRRLHFLHHGSVGTREDPEFALRNYEEFRFPLSTAGMARVLAGDLSGANFLRYRLRTASGRRLLAATLAATGLLWASAPPLAGAWALWWIAHATWFQMILRLRLMFEHQGADLGPLGTRTIVPRLAERILLIPGHVNYHVEHHLYPGVPAHRLPGLHRRLLANPGYAELASTRFGWLATLKSFVAGRPHAPLPGAAP
jgi:fatty acid desaturase